MTKYLSLFALCCLVLTNSLAQEPSIALPTEWYLNYLHNEGPTAPEGAQLAIGIITPNGQATIGFCRNGAQLEPCDNEEAHFEIGSVTKLFTASMLGQLIEEGKLAVNDPAQNHLPEDWPVPQWERKKEQVPITLEHLATHHSGLQRNPLQMEYLMQNEADPWSLYGQDQLLYDLREAKLKKRPGTKFSYSNVGFTLLGQVLSAVEEKNFDDLVSERIFAPLGMTSSVVGMTNLPEDQIGLTGFDRDGKAVPNWTFNIAAPAGGIISNSRDMLRFLSWNMGLDSSLNRAAADRCHAILEKGPSNGTRFSYTGLGWLVVDTELFPGRFPYQDQLLWHDGGTSGFQSYLGFLKEQQLGVVVLTNFRSPKWDLIHFGEALLAKLVEMQ